MNRADIVDYLNEGEGYTYWLKDSNESVCVTKERILVLKHTTNQLIEVQSFFYPNIVGVKWKSWDSSSAVIHIQTEERYVEMNCSTEQAKRLQMEIMNAKRKAN